MAIYPDFLDLGEGMELVGPAKTPEPIDMQFGLRTWMGPGNHVLDESPVPPWEGKIFRGKGRRIVKCRDTLRSSVQKRLNRLRCRLGCGLGWAKATTC